MQRHWVYLCKTCESNLQLKETHCQTDTAQPPNAVVPISCPSCNAVFNATRLERGNPKGVRGHINIDFRLTN